MKLHVPELLVISLIAGTTLLPPQSYNIHDLGAVPGQNASAGYGLNGFGQAAGTSSSPNGAIATLFSGGKAVDLGTLEPLDVSVATGHQRIQRIFSLKSSISCWHREMSGASRSPFKGVFKKSL